MDALWTGFLATRQVPLRELEAIPGVSTTCEKSTLAKYSYMKAYAAYCGGDLDQAPRHSRKSDPPSRRRPLTGASPM